MKLWLLRPIEGLEDGNNPWKSLYDMCFGFVIRAEKENEARLMADDRAGDENGNSHNRKHPWLNPAYSSCVELTDDGKPGVIIKDEHWG